jgi:hypothetical protein
VRAISEESEDPDGMPLAIPFGSIRACLLAMEDLIRLAYSDGGDQVGYDPKRAGFHPRGGGGARGRGRGRGGHAVADGVGAGMPAGGGRGNNGIMGACACVGTCQRMCPCKNNNPSKTCCAGCGCRAPGHPACKNI